ncbi:MAG: PspC domain-containing protein [Candidatus Neomarinimicrobiota bacterium]
MKKLYRSERDRKIAGVCGGIGEYFDVDSSLLRLLWLILVLLGGVGVVAYIIAMIIIPRNPNDSIETAEVKKEEETVKPRSGNNARIFWGILLILLGVFFGMKQIWYFDRVFDEIRYFMKDFFIPAALVVIGIYIIVQNDKKNRKPGE